MRLRSLGCDVLAVERNRAGFRAEVPCLTLDLDSPDLASQIGEGQFDLVTATEVIEHIENPIGFLRNVGRLLSAKGVAVLTTPNVDNLMARIKFLARGKVRMLDEQGDPTHITPIFMDLLVRQYLPRAGLEMAEHLLYPPRGYLVTRPLLVAACRPVGWFVRGDSLEGDNHVFVFRKGTKGE